MIDFIKAAANVIPSNKQLNWYELEQYAFIHFGVNTYTNKEWGDGSEPESIFNPVKLDCDQWVDAIKSAGLKGMVLTAKHHDGFCLWPSAYTEHSVKNSPIKTDIVKEASEACRRGGIKFGFYLSPWDMNSKFYGTDKYNDYFCNQLTELLTGYGEIFHVWFDNAYGEGPDGIKQEYDFERYFDLIKKYQPNATIYNDFGPDVRWCGNEAGTGRSSEWAVVPGELCKFGNVQTGKGPLADETDLSYLFNTNSRLGDLHQIICSKGLTFVPSEIDTSIRKGWFWHPEEEPKSVQELFNIYLNSVGNNACLHLNIPPNKDGLIDKKDIIRLKEYGEFLRSTFGESINFKQEIISGTSRFQPEYILTLDRPLSEVKYIVLGEDISKGQRIEEFMIYTNQNGGTSFPIYKGCTVGYKKICCITDPFAEQNNLLRSNCETKEIRIKITSARDEVNLNDIKIY